MISLGRRWSSYRYYLNTRITETAIERIYTRLTTNPDFTLSDPVEDCISFTRDNKSYSSKRKGGDIYCEIYFRDLLDIYLINHDIPDGKTGGWSIDPLLGNGERQFEVHWHHAKYGDLFAVPDEELDIVTDVFPLLSIIVEELDPFLGIFGLEDHFEIEDESEYDIISPFDFIKKMMGQAPSQWASFFLDNRLLKDIASEPLAKWSEIRIPVGDLGQHIERDRIPLMGGQLSPNNELWEEKDEIFLDHILPKIIARLGEEFGYM